MFGRYLLKDKTIINKIDQALMETYFVDYNQAFLKTKAGIDDIKQNVYRRYNASVEYILPWVNRHIDLNGKIAVEIGTGTGPCAAAFGFFVDQLTTYDIHKPSVLGAIKRMEIMGLNNVDVKLIKENELIERLKNDYHNGVDIFLLSAVLEHQTITERIETIRAGWELLNPDGVLVVTESPNRLTYFDHHTTLMPFFHFLPDDLAFIYFDKVPRNAFKDSLKEELSISKDKAILSRARWGTGLSYHEFEIALGNRYQNYIVASGFEEEMLRWVGTTLEEELLRKYFIVNNLDILLGFTRHYLNLIFKKQEDPKKSIDEKPPPFERICSEDIEALKMELGDKMKREAEMQNAVIADYKDALAAVHNCFSYKLGIFITRPYRIFRKLFQ